MYHCFHFFSHLFAMNWWWTDAMILIFWKLNFKPAFSLSSFTLIERLFSSSSFSAIRVVSFAYLRLLIFLLAILIPACESSLNLGWENNQVNHLSPFRLKQGVLPCSLFLGKFASVSPFSFILCVDFCRGMDKTAVSPSLDRVVL